MIKRELYYIVICDVCGKRLSENEYDLLHKEKNETTEELEDQGWIKKGRKTFCPECQVP